MKEKYYNLYPFRSFYEFLFDLYFLKLEALHLTIGLIIYTVFILYLLFFNTKINLTLKLSLIFFAGTIFNNDAYRIYLSIAEFFGVIATLLFLFRGKLKLNPISLYMLLFFLISLTHFLFLLVLEPKILESINTIGFVRVVPFFKIAVLSINIMILFVYLDDYDKVEKFLKHAIFLFNAVLLCYFIQITLFLLGVLPYGSFSPAGWTESIIPSFGSTSVERGHLGKFLVPLFPIYLYMYKRMKYKKSFYFFLAVSFLNFSASSYAFLTLYILGTIFLLFNFFKKVVFNATLFIVFILSVFAEEIYGLVMKIYILSISTGETGGGREFSFIYNIWDKYPIGYGYGGSTFRNFAFPGYDLNNAIVVFFGQLSVVSIPIIMIFVYIIYKIINTSKYLKHNYIMERKLLILSIFVMIFIFLADVLWFVPTIWLPVAIFTILAINEKKSVLKNT